MSSVDEAVNNYLDTGDNKMLSDVFMANFQKLYGLAYYYLHNRDDALDTVMDTFEAVLKNIHKRDVKNFTSWTMGICRNTSLKKIRDTKKFSELTEVSGVVMHEEEDDLYNETNFNKLKQCIENLKERQRQCVKYFYLENQSYEQVSELTGYTAKEVKSYIQNGKRNLKILFDK